MYLSCIQHCTVQAMLWVLRTNKLCGGINNWLEIVLLCASVNYNEKNFKPCEIILEIGSVFFISTTLKLQHNFLFHADFFR